MYLDSVSCFNIPGEDPRTPSVASLRSHILPFPQPIARCLLSPGHLCLPRLQEISTLRIPRVNAERKMPISPQNPSAFTTYRPSTALQVQTRPPLDTTPYRVQRSIRCTYGQEKPAKTCPSVPLLDLRPRSVPVPPPPRGQQTVSARAVPSIQAPPPLHRGLDPRSPPSAAPFRQTAAHRPPLEASRRALLVRQGPISACGAPQPFAYGTESPSWCG